MPISLTKNVLEADLREQILTHMTMDDSFVQVKNGSYKMVLTDKNGDDRLVEVRFVIGKVEEERTAQERLEAEIADWNDKKEKKEQKKKERAEKAEADRKKRLEKKAKEENQAEA